uniref:Uncharacterized protein n=1 Tax=Tanacetum cinerariifolium TaxID=118510 RepID=A0A699JNV4_TANCI|nr:hypothetical protein [Tanacetum cinerariifolium]
MRPFGCHVTMLNTLDPLGKFDGKADEGFLVGCSVNSKAFRVFNSRTKIVQETLHLNFLENRPNFAGIGPKWLFEIDTLTMSMNYQIVVAGNQPNDNAGFEDLNYPNKVYKVVKALYGLHQAPRAWYETLTNYLLENGFQRGKIDQTLFIKKQKGDILLVQVYLDDIIFGFTNKELCKAFEKLMKDKFQMSSMRELTYFLGLQVKQKNDVIFISKDKYVAKILRKFSFTDVKSASTPIKTEKHLLKDPNGEDVDVHIYRSMIGSLMYLTSSRPDIMFAVCACARLQVTPKVSHLHAVKRITVVATSSTEAGYVAAASCCAQVLLIQNQLLDYSKELASPKQTSLGKDISNPFMDGSLPKTIW